MSNPNEHIEDFLKYYFELEKPPHYAVLLKGKWGVGKTWFLNRFFESIQNPDYNVKKHLYISLYGITDTKQIETELFRQLHPFLSSEGMKLAGKISKGLLKATLKIDLDNDDKSDGSVSIQVPDIKLSDYLTNTDGFVLVFDDLERASMDLEALLGYINHYVEHQGYKVILIANEEELLQIKQNDDYEAESTNKNIGYRRIKEKLIGKTFEIQPNLELAINNFIQEIENKTTREFYLDNSKLIKNLYQSSGYWNLRHLRQALMDFARILELISDETKQKERVIEHLLSIYLIFSFEIKSGEMLPADIKNFEELYVLNLMSRTGMQESKNNTESDRYIKFKEKYPSFDAFDLLLDKNIWIDIFDKGLLDKAKIEESLRSSRYFNNDNQPEWMQLWHYMYLEDDEFAELLKNVSNDFEDKKIGDLDVIKHITGIFLELSEQGLLDKTKVEILQLAKSNIDDLVEKDISLSSSMKYYDDTGSRGLGYQNRDDRAFEELTKYILHMSKKQIDDSLPRMGMELLKNIKSDISNLKDKLSYDGKLNNFHLYPVLSYIKPIDFVKAIFEIDPIQRREVVLTISSRYKRCGDLKRLLPEICWLQEVVKLLLSEAENRKGKVSGYQVKTFTNAYFISSITILHQESLKEWQAKYYSWEPYLNNIDLLKQPVFSI